MAKSETRYVLGVDAAWTDREPSGVALISYDENKRRKSRLIKIARSYSEFCSDKPIDWETIPIGSPPDIGNLLLHCKDGGRQIQRKHISVIALDIPLSPTQITERRTADNEIAKKYGTRWASTHSPTPKRPGKISTTLFNQLVKNGFHWLCNTSNMSGRHRSFIEVYPHTALIELDNLKKRLPYKLDNRKKYWPQDTPDERINKIIDNHFYICGILMRHIDNITDHFIGGIGEITSPTLLKGQEDALDAVICALVGWFFVKGEAEPYGDEKSVIWVPNI